MQTSTRINKITTGYQITIPASYRKQNHLEIGDYVSFRYDKNKLIIEPLEKQIEKQNAIEVFNNLFKQEIVDELSKLDEGKVLDVVNTEIKLSRINNDQKTNNGN